MFPWVEAATAAARSWLTDVDPDTLSSSDAAALVSAFAELARLLDSCQVLVAGRAAAGHAWQRSGHRNPADWLAAQLGTTRGRAASVLFTASALSACPAAEQALRAGDLSGDQAAAITAAAAADPNAAQELLAAASSIDVEGLRLRCRQVTAAARPADLAAAQRRIHAGRYLRTWTDEEGGVNGRFRLAAEQGARLLSTLECFHDKVFQQRRGSGVEVDPATLAADALSTMADAAVAGGTSIRPTILVRVDLAALQRGATLPGEECSIDGVGPVAVDVARSMWSEGVLAALLVDDQGRVVDLRLPGRCMPRRLRLAVQARDRECVVPGCGATQHVEIHHLHAVDEGGQSYLDNLALLCRWHHRQVTAGTAQLTGPPGRWRWCTTPVDIDPDVGPFDDAGLRLTG
jgi:hypothetical protein